MDRRLTVKQEEVRADGTARHKGGILSKDGAGWSRGMTIVGRETISKESISIGARRYIRTYGRWNRNGVVHLCKDEDTRVCTGHRGVVRLSCHGVNLLRRFLVRANCGDVTLFAAISADDHWSLVPTRDGTRRR
jgi:hypothetical protein